MVPVAGDSIPIQLPPLRPVVSPLGLYQDHKANNDHPQDNGPESDHIHRRHPGHGKHRVPGKGTHCSSDIPPGELGVYNKLPKIPPHSYSGDRIPRPHGEFSDYGNQNARRKDQADTPRNQKTPGDQYLHAGTNPITPTRETQSCHPGNPSSPPVLQKPAAMSAKGTGNKGRERLWSHGSPDRGSQKGTDMVARTPYKVEWAVLTATDSRHGNRNRCLNHRLGSMLSRCPDRGTVVTDRKDEPYKLSGVASSQASSDVLCQRQKEHPNPFKDGQYNSPHVYQQVRRNCFLRTKPTDKESMDLVSGQEHNAPGYSPGRHSKCHSGRGIACDEGQDRLDALSTDIHKNKSDYRTTTSRPVCVPPDSPTTGLCELETRSRSNGNRCLHSRLDTVPWICKPNMESGGQNLVSGQEPKGSTGTGSSSVEVPGMVPNLTGNAGSGTNPVTKRARLDSADSQSQQTRCNPTTSRMGYLRNRFQNQNISEGASTLLLASWRQKTTKSYDSLFGKWLGWCNERGSDPISGNIYEVVNFLADLFKQGYQYRSLNSYRSAISSVHEKVDGYEVGKHPLVTRLIKGAFHERPPQPRYSGTWDVSRVTSYFVSRGANQNLSINDLTCKTVMLMALTRPSRSADLVNLNLDYRKFSPEGVTFMPTKLAKQSVQSKPLTDFFFPAFPGNSLLCPVVTLRAYEDRTEKNRDDNESQLFIATIYIYIKPFKPVTSSTIARWIKSVLTKSGIDTNTFKAHSVRSAAVSSAASAGMTTNDILSAADFKTVKNSTFGSTVLSMLSTTGK